MTIQMELYTVNVSNIRTIGLLIAVVIGFSACFKKDVQIKLPAKTGASLMQITMGSTYDTCYFINLDNAAVIKKYLITDWDIRFDATDNGHVVLMNSGNHNLRIIKSNTDNMKGAITIPPLDTTWGYDPPTAWVDSAYLQNWQDGNGNTKNEVYLVRRGDAVNALSYYKFKILSVSQGEYVIQYDTVDGIEPKTISIPKNVEKNFSYFSFNNGGKVVDIEPAKTSWDICFMQYHQPFYNSTPFLYYPVVGCLSNSYNTQCGGDTTLATSFNTFSLDQVNQYPLNSFANTIGYNWKKPDANFIYTTYPEYLYLVKTQLGHLYKLHFLDFYYQGLEKGAPKFEFERLD